jgi:hypothetical protein
MRTNVRVVLTTNQKGAIAETRITAAAVELGIEVYRPVAEGGRYDMILAVGDRLLRTQCKWARRRGDVLVIGIRTSRYTPRGYIRTTYSAQEVDGIAAWCADTQECYFIPIADVDGQGISTCVWHRRETTRNCLYTGRLTTGLGL